MAHTPRFYLGPKGQIPADLEELRSQLAQLPEPQRQALMSLYDRVVDNFRLRNRILHVAKESLARLRLELAFMRFDLEATRREKEAFRKELDGE